MPLWRKSSRLLIFSVMTTLKIRDAHIEIKDGEYNVIEEKKGCKPIYDSILAEVKDALDNELQSLP